MIPELGFYALILATILSIFQCSIPMLGVYRQRESWMKLARPLSIGTCFFIVFAFICLLYSFIHNDFSVAYVFRHSNASLPLYYKISAIWAGHEGSILLITLILSIWTVIFSLNSRFLPLNYSTLTIAILAGLLLGFLLFLLGLSNPFARILPNFPIDGNDLNPLLQDFALTIHPPILFIGYIGFAIPFALVTAFFMIKRKQCVQQSRKNIKSQNIDPQDINLQELTQQDLAIQENIARTMRPWVLTAWAFLGLGITLGSWWAYYELGWGGWWFWDPVENISLMPWLMGIALIHSLMLSDKRKSHFYWTSLLALSAFILSMIGTFLIRSGILSSVHSFATDPKKGAYLFVFLWVIILFSFHYYLIETKKIIFKSIEKVVVFWKPYYFSRETLIVLMTILLYLTTAAILLGTLLPLFSENFFQQKLFIGFSYFNIVFIAIMLPVLFFVPVGPLIHWGDNPFKNLWKLLKLSLLLSVIISTTLVILSLFLFPNKFPFFLLIGVFIASWIILGTLKSFIIKIKKRNGLFKLSAGAVGMLLAHFGIAVTIIGITFVSQFEIEKEVKLAPNDTVALSSYVLQFKGMKKIEGSNYIGYQANFLLFKNNPNEKELELIKELFPEKRTFVVQELSTSEMAIDWGFFRDIDIAIGERLDHTINNNNVWSFKLFYKPFVRWIWLGGILMTLGGLCAAYGRRAKNIHILSTN